MKSFLTDAVIFGLSVALGFLIGSTYCHAGDLQLMGGTTGSAAVLQLEYKWAQQPAAHLETGVTVVGPSEHHHGYAQFQGHQAPNYFADTSLVGEAGPFELGAGVAFIQETDAYTSEGLNFRLLGGYRHGKFHITWNHFSNARLKHPNMGRDMLLVGWDL